MAERASKILRKPAENVDVEDWHNHMLVDFNGLQDEKACADSAAVSVIWLESSGFHVGEDAVEIKAAFRPSSQKLVKVYCTTPSARPTVRAAPQ